MIKVTVKGIREAEARYLRAAKETGSALEKAVARSSVLLSRETRLQLSGKGGSDPFLGRKGAPAPFLGSRSGGTRSRITPGGQVYRSGNAYTSSVGSPDGYMKMHEEGGTIAGNKFLRIPLAGAQTAGGSERGEFLGKSLRDVPGLFLIRTLGGRLLAVRQRGGRTKTGHLKNAPAARNRGALDFLYLLVRSVKIPARRPFAAVRDRVAPRVNAITSGEVSLVMRRANGG